MDSFFEPLVDAVRNHGLTLAIGTTLLLLAFAVLVRSTRSLSKKNALASTAMLAVAGYLAVAIVPLPRWTGSLGRSVEPATPPAKTGREPGPVQRAPADEGSLFAGGGTAPAAAIEHPVSLPAAAASQPRRATQDDLAAVEPPAEPAVDQGAAGRRPAGWIAALALVGAALCSLHLLIGWLRLRRVLRDSREAPTEVAELIDLPAGTRVRIARRAVQPFCFGLHRATIVLPQRLASATEETRFVLLHERAHLTSGDTRARLVAALLRPVLFWHPLYWWLQHQLRFTSELLADDAAAEGSVADYVRCMMTLSTHPDPAAGGALVATIFRRRSELFRRLEMMLQRNEAITHSQSRRSRWSRAAATLALVGICASALGVQPAMAQSTGGRSPAEEPQSPRSAAVRKQVQELRAELKRLQVELSALRAERKNSQADFISFGRLNQATGRVEPVAPNGTKGDTPQPTLLPGSSQGTHTIKVGDTLAKIARRHYGSAKRVDQLLKLNPDINPRMLRVGEQLKLRHDTNLPGAGRAGGSLPGKANSKNRNSAIGLGGGGGSGGLSTKAPRAGGPGAGGTNAAPRANPRNGRPGGGARAPAPAPARATRGSTSELAGLVTRCIELQGEVEIARINLQYTNTKREREIGKVKLRTAEKQHSAMRAMLAAEMKRAEVELAHARKLHDKGFVTTADLRASEGKVALLARALK